jgi:xylan 1,4-beta-xylosidase
MTKPNSDFGFFFISSYNQPDMNRTFPPHWIFLFAAVLFALSLHAQSPVTIHVDAAKSLGPFAPVWDYFGYDEPNYTYAPHGRELIDELVVLSPGTVQIRTHNLLTTGDGTPALKWGSTNAYTEDAAGRPIYDWTIVDRILDTYVQSGAKPFVEIGFMPEALSTHPEPYQHHWPKDDLYVGWTYPPKEYAKWAELIRQWVLHCVAKYGKDAVASWNWEVWNEPNIGYWHGTPEEYDKLYDYAVDAVKRALPQAKVGGPATTGPSGEKAAEYLRQFLQHCATGTNFATGKMGAPLDFITFHAKGAPKVTDGRVMMGLSNQLNDVDHGLAIIATFPKFSHLPVVLSESDPEGCAACSAHDHPQNAYRNGTLYPTYTAVSIKNMLDLNQRHKTNLAGILTWAFEFEDQPYFYGFRTLATNGVDKPVLNVFRMLGLMSSERIEVKSSAAVDVEQILKSGVREAADIDGFASRGDYRVTVLLWNYHDDENGGSDAPARLDVSGLHVNGHKLLLREYRIDQSHSNSYTVWKAMGSPQNPTSEQIAALKAAGQLQMAGSPRWVESTNKDGVIVDLSLSRQSVALVELSW